MEPSSDISVSTSIISSSVRCIVDQQSAEACQLAANFGLLGDGNVTCGFLALATLLIVDVSQLNQATILRCVEQTVLPRVMSRRIAYADRHPDEFVSDGTCWQESGGRMNRTSYLKGMASAVDIAHSIELEEWHDASVNVAFLRNVWEGPSFNSASVRCPRGDLFYE